ncbi:MAG: metallophosphoesterase [Deltaproteobacteria bacterium]|nr:metallophosphoesterase [Deltaproteobacteria bacterium]
MRFIHTADTHLGFELVKTPAQDAPGRRERAARIGANFQAVVDRTLECRADLFIHGGDLFNKHYLPRLLLEEWIRPLLDLDRAGIPVLVIPGNHERSEFPYDLFHGFKNAVVFDRPKSIVLNAGGYRLGVAGFPFIRDNSRDFFLKALEETGYRDLQTDINFLITHQAFDQAVVGPEAFVFRSGRRDTVDRHTLPPDFDYIAAGHVHRFQVLDHPRRPGVKFVYPGSSQRMSFAEKDEEKGFIEGEIEGQRIHIRFRPLPAYALESVEIQAAGLTGEELEREIIRQSWRADEDLIIRFNLTGGATAGDYPDLDYQRLRTLFPPVLECQFALRLKGRWVFR